MWFLSDINGSLQRNQEYRVEAATLSGVMMIGWWYLNKELKTAGNRATEIFAGKLFQGAGTATAAFWSLTMPAMSKQQKDASLKGSEHEEEREEIYLNMCVGFLFVCFWFGDMI